MKKVVALTLCFIAAIFLCSCVTSSDQSTKSYNEGYEDGYKEGYEDGIRYANEGITEDLEEGPYCELCGVPKTNSEGITDDFGMENHAGDIYYWLCNRCVDNLGESRTPLYVGNEPVYIEQIKLCRDPMGFYIQQPFWFETVGPIDEYRETDTLTVRYDHVENDDSILYVRSDWIVNNHEIAESFGFNNQNRDECDLSVLIDQNTDNKLLDLPDDYELRYYEDVPFVVSYTYDESAESITCVNIYTILNGITIRYFYFTDYVGDYWQEETISDLISIHPDICFPTGAEATAFFERATDN